MLVNSELALCFGKGQCAESSYLKYHTNDFWDAWKSFDQNIQNKELASNDSNKWESYYRGLFNENRINSYDLDKLGSHLNNQKKSYNNTN